MGLLWVIVWLGEDCLQLRTEQGPEKQDRGADFLLCDPPTATHHVGGVTGGLLGGC